MRPARLGADPSGEQHVLAGVHRAESAICAGDTPSGASNSNSSRVLRSETAAARSQCYPLGSDKQVTSEPNSSPAPTAISPRTCAPAGSTRICSRGSRCGRSISRPCAGTPEDLAPNLDYEVDPISVELGVRLSFARPARAAIHWMATFAGGGRIDAASVAGEIARLETDTRTGGCR